MSIIYSFESTKLNWLFVHVVFVVTQWPVTRFSEDHHFLTYHVALVFLLFDNYLLPFLSFKWPAITLLTLLDLLIFHHSHWRLLIHRLRLLVWLVVQRGQLFCLLLYLLLREFKRLRKRRLILTETWFHWLIISPIGRHHRPSFRIKRGLILSL